MAAEYHLPREVFELVPSLLYAPFLRILDSVELTAPQLFALSYLRHYGSALNDGPAASMATLTGVLARVHGLGRPGASSFVSRLQENGFVVKRGMTEKEKNEHFKNSPGHHWVVVLCKPGARKLDDFNEEVEKLFRELTSPIPDLVMKSFLAAFKIAAPVLRKSLKAQFSPPLPGD